MYEFFPYYTNDGSVGLYSKENSDVYHSCYGALSEAYEKFICPSNINYLIKSKSDIKVLDICYGIGYNSKSFLNYFFKNFLKNSFTFNNHIASIHTDNIFTKKDKLFSACKNKKIKIDCIDTNKNLIKLSPFIKTDKKIVFENKNKVFELKKILKHDFSNVSFFIKKNNYKINQEINFIILIKLIDQYKDDFFTSEIEKVLTEKDNQRYFDKNMLNFARYLKKRGCKLSSEANNLGYLHNIYYQYISKSYKNTLNVLENNNINMNFITDDARIALKSTDMVYDLMFLDAFTPTKAPSLWTIDFFKLLYNHLSENGMILTYSTSASVRNAFLQNNFLVGKIYNEREKKFSGTIATKNNKFLQYPLDDFDIGLINTKAGIVYKDIDLNLSNEKIINDRLESVKNSKLIPSTKYFKKYKGEHNGI